MQIWKQNANPYGYDPRSHLGGRYPESVRWTELLNASGLKVISEGENGLSIPRLNWEIETAAETIYLSKAREIIVMLGNNDLLQPPRLSAEACAVRMESFLAALLAKVQADLRVLLVAPPPMIEGAWGNDPRTLEESHRLAGCYEAAAHRLGIGFADAGTWGVELTYDGVHFSEKGHLTFATGILVAKDNFLQGTNGTI